MEDWQVTAPKELAFKTRAWMPVTKWVHWQADESEGLPLARPVWKFQMVGNFTKQAFLYNKLQLLFCAGKKRKLNDDYNY